MAVSVNGSTRRRLPGRASVRVNKSGSNLPFVCLESLQKTPGSTRFGAIREAEVKCDANGTSSAARRPHGCLRRPARIFVAALKLLVGIGERACVTGRFVFRDAGPILRFRRRVGVGMSAHDLAEPSLRLLEIG